MTKLVEQLRDAVNRFYGKEPAGLLAQAADDLEWYDKQLNRIAGGIPTRFMKNPDGTDVPLHEAVDAMMIENVTLAIKLRKETGEKSDQLA